MKSWVLGFFSLPSIRVLFEFVMFRSKVYPHTGKPTEEPNEYYVKGTINYIKKLIEKLEKFQNIRGRNISMDRLYTSFEIADWLLNRCITMIGTIMSNRVGIPKEIKPVTKRHQFLPSLTAQ